MSSAQTVAIVTAVSVPVVTAILGVIGVMFQDWRARKTQAGRRKLALEDARRQVSFATEWWNARKLLADSTEAVQEATASAMAWLDQASARATASEPPGAEEKTPITFRRLMLFYRLQGTAANIIRGGFYLLLGLLVIAVGQTLDTLRGPGKFILGDFVVTVVIAFAALGLRFWAVSAQSPTRKRRRIRWTTLQRALLFYRLNRPSASLVRISFYILVVFEVFYLSTLVDDISNNHFGTFAVDVSFFIALAGYAVGLRYWAASLGVAPKDGRESLEFSPDIATSAAESSTQNAQSVLDRQPDQGDSMATGPLPRSYRRPQPPPLQSLVLQSAHGAIR
jgi:hypothetical protein